MNLFPHISGNEIAMVVCRNGWFYGIPVFLLGVHLRKIIYCGIHPKVWLLKAVGMVSFILIGIERLLVGYSQLYFGNMLLLVSFFLLCINNPTVFNLRWLQKIVDTYSTDLYIIHWAVINLCDKILRVFRLDDNMGLLALMVMPLSLLSTVFLRFVRRQIFKNMKRGAVL